MKADVPRGLEHLRLLDAGAIRALSSGKSALVGKQISLKLTGVALTILYEAATCHRKCYGGQHVFEAICGRAYNLAASAFQLLKIGYYDEALNLTRGIGEITNLVALSVVDKESFQKWINGDTQTRLREFGPAQVRKLIARQDAEHLYADKDWYSDLCERYTHVTPETKPNFHNDERATCGGRFQPAGLDKSLSELTTVLGILSMYVAKYFKFDDLFAELVEILKEDNQKS